MPLLHLRNVSLAHPQAEALGAGLAIGARFLQALVLHGTGLNDQACPLSASLGGPLSTFRSAGLAHRVLAAHGGRRFPRSSLRFLDRPSRCSISLETHWDRSVCATRRASVRGPVRPAPRKDSAHCSRAGWCLQRGNVKDHGGIGAPRTDNETYEPDRDHELERSREARVLHRCPVAPSADATHLCPGACADGLC
jgi:hypothetical protein